MPVVSLAASPPSRETIHKSPAYEKTMFVLLNVGLRISSGLFSCACAAPASKRMQKRGSNTFFITHSPWDKPALSGVDFVPHKLLDPMGLQTSFRIGEQMEEGNRLTKRLYCLLLISSLPQGERLISNGTVTRLVLYPSGKNDLGGTCSLVVAVLSHI